MKNLTHPAGLPRARRGIASIWVVLVLFVISALIATATWQHLASRRVLRDRHHRLQADWLARAGVERAAARLLADPKGYQGETTEIIPESRVQIEVRTEAGTPDVYHVTSTARYPANAGLHVVVRSVQRTFRRTADNEMVRLEAVPTGKQGK